MNTTIEFLARKCVYVSKINFLIYSVVDLQAFHFTGLYTDLIGKVFFCTQWRHQKKFEQLYLGNK